MDTILQASLTGLLEVFAWPAFGLMLLAIVVGFFVGIIPFVSIPMTLALMLPFTFGMTPVEAFAFLLGMLSISIIFSDITSIIFGVPGEPVTAAIILDGHPMAKLGQTGRALGAAFMSSLIGSIIGAVVLAASVPVVRPIALSFGAPEFFGMAVLGILFIAALSGGNTTKGVLMGLMGLMLSMVGMDPQSGTQRFTLGMIELYDGLGLIPVTVGLFGVAELVDLWLKQKSIAEVAVGKIGGVWQGCKDTFAHIGLTLRCSFLGAFLGIIPGLGGAIAQWLAYAHAVQSAKDKSQFGKGDVRGVIGPGATMNAKEGGNLITTVAFGVPSTVTMAILLGAFLIQGVVPGPDMLTKNLDLTMSFVWIVILSHVIGIGLCFLLINQMVKITEIRSSLLLPAILLLALLGGFADKSSLFDMLTAVGAGFVGLAMVRLDWPRPPLILGLVLGRIAENNFFIAYTRYGVSFVLRPVLIFVILTCVVLLLAPTFQKMLGRHAGVRKELLLAEEG